MDDLSRRRFIEMTMGAAAAALVSACASPASVFTSALEPTALGAATPQRGKTVQNENRKDRNVRYFKPFIPPKPEEWRLTVGGLVSTPLSLSLGDLQQVSFAEQTSRMKCVECWSFKATWGGFALSSLLEHVQPKETGHYVRLSCGDGYWEVLPVQDLIRDRVLFAYRMEGEFLADEYGSPLRLIVPWKYGYKGAKCITGLEFVAKEGAGYWSTVGPYTIQGDIEEGYDFPQDLGQRVPITEAGKELAY